MDPNSRATQSDTASSSSSCSEPDSNDIAQYHQDSRQRMVNKIVDGLKRHFPALPEGSSIIKQLAAEIEEGAFSSAVNNSDDYITKIKMLYREKVEQQALDISRRSNNSVHNQYQTNQGLRMMSPPPSLELSLGNSSQSPVMPMMRSSTPRQQQQYHQQPLLQGWMGPTGSDNIMLSIQTHQRLQDQLPYNQAVTGSAMMSAPSTAEMQQNQLNPVQLSAVPGGTGSRGEPALSASSSAGPALEANPGWRLQLPYETRLRTVNFIMDTLKRQGPALVPEALCHDFASDLEEKIYNTAISQPDYLRQIALKTLSMTNKQPGLNPSLPNQNRIDQAAPLDLTAQMRHLPHWLKNEQQLQVAEASNQPQLSPLQLQHQRSQLRPQQPPQAGILSNQSQLRPHQLPQAGILSNQSQLRPQQQPQAGILSNQSQLRPQQMPLAGILSNRSQLWLHQSPQAGILSNQSQLRLQQPPQEGILSNRSQLWPFRQQQQPTLRPQQPPQAAILSNQVQQRQQPSSQSQQQHQEGALSNQAQLAPLQQQQPPVQPHQQSRLNSNPCDCERCVGMRKKRRF